MNIQSSSQPSPTPSPDASSLRLKEIEQAAQKAKTGVVVWTLSAAAAYLMSGWASEPTSSLMFQASVVALVVGIIYAGRWSLARQLEGQVRIQRQLKEVIDWSDIPQSGFASEIRFFASLDEAKERGWKMGPDAGVINAQLIPEWIEMEENRFFFDGLVSPRGVSSVPENVRILGRLRFVKQEADTPEEDSSQSAPIDLVAPEECKAS